MKGLKWRLASLLLLAAATSLLLHAGLTLWPWPQLLLRWDTALGLHWQALAPGSLPALLWTLGLMALGAWWLAAAVTAPMERLLRALEGSVLSYRDGDYSMSIAPQRAGGLGELVRLHSELGHALREQRQHLAQRELLLDTVVQNTPVALVLTDVSPHPQARDPSVVQELVAIANIAARQLLGDGRSLVGADFTALLADLPEAMRRALLAGEDTLFSLSVDGMEETFHLSQRTFRLQGRPHRLRLIRRMTRELSRQEVATWKRVIRVISHELNNSLAPISSLAHSGAELARRGQLERLPGVFASIGERATHLHRFLEGYARFAKLPAPQLQPVAWADFLAGLAAHCEFQRQGEVPAGPASFDAAQIEQALINLIKNAHEAGGAPTEVTLAVTLGRQELRFDVGDRGPGMSDAVLAQALLPFYSTKRAGTGLGLALAREIAEAHGGRIALVNRTGGGLLVSLSLPVLPL